MVLPATQEMQESNMALWPEPILPPQTTSLPPDRRERLGPRLGCGRSGMEQRGLGGNNSTLEMTLLSSPPTTTCPDAGVRDGVHRKKRF